MPGVFESRTNHPDYGQQRAELRELLSAQEYAAAEPTNPQRPRH
ncbi:hypothetical protein ACGFIY_33125 [Micromonospora chersina]